jgi:hypothetical protein
MTPRIENDTLIIPLDSDPKYHHWNGGQRLIETLGELDAPASLFKNHAFHKDGHTGETCGCGKQAKATSEVFYCVPCGAWWEKG